MKYPLQLTRLFGVFTLLCIASGGVSTYAAPTDAVTTALPATETPTTATSPLVQLARNTTYDVQMTTSFVIPDDGKKVGEVRVWHALPTPRGWNLSSDGSGARDILFEPKDGKEEQRADKGSQHIVWRQKGNFAPGTRLSYSTHYKVHSAARTFDPASVATQWPTDFTPPADTNPELASVADQIRAAYRPAQTVLAFSIWLKRNITYDASVNYPANDITSSLAYQRGHCGHFYYLFAQMCRRVGIPVRVVRGLNLQNADGHGRLAHVRADWTNVHSWAEVFFPEVGWVEVEPSYGANAFSIPANFVQNNTWFQNYVLQIFVDGKLQDIGWTPERGGFVSPYEVENLITFTDSPD